MKEKKFQEDRRERDRAKRILDIGPIGFLYLFVVLFALCSLFAIVWFFIMIEPTIITLVLAVVSASSSVISFFLINKFQDIAWYLQRYVPLKDKEDQ